MPKDSRARRERMRQAKRRARAAESDEARRARLAKDAARMAKKRAEETPEMRAERLSSNAARVAYLRARRARDYQRRKLEEETTALREERLAREAIRHLEVRCVRLQQACHDNCNPARFEEMEVTIEDDESNSVKNRLSDLDSDAENAVETTAPSAAAAADSCDEDVYVPVMHQRSKTSELVMECEEEELEPWQKHTLTVHLKEEEDDGE